MAELIEEDKACHLCFQDADFYYIPWKRYLCDDCTLVVLKDTLGLDIKIEGED